MGDNPTLHNWRCRRTEGETAPGHEDHANHACWIQPPDGPRILVERPGGCLAETIDDAERCAEETLTPEPAGRQAGH